MRTAEININRFIERIRPYLTELYRRAEVIVANEDCAEYIVQNVITEAFPLYLEARGRAAFQEGLYGLVRNIALFELNSIRANEDFAQDSEETVDRSLFQEPQNSNEAVDVALLTRLLREKYVMRRMLMLKYGCGMSASQIAVVLNMRASDVRQRLRVLNARLFRGAQGAQVPALEKHLTSLAQLALNRQGEDVPDMTTIFKLFSENIQDSKMVKNHRVSKAVHVAVMIFSGVLCAALFWVISILLVPNDSIPVNEVEIGMVDNIHFN